MAASIGVERDRRRHGPPRPPQHPLQRHGQAGHRAIFHEFAGGATNPADVGGSGDVKYHLGTSSDREFDGNKVHLSLLPNPSHLEAVDPVVLGKARAVQTIKRRRSRARPCCRCCSTATPPSPARAWSGNASSFSGLPGYGTGGTIHFIINNQVGFTTSPQFAPLVALSVGRRQGRPGADPPRQRRRSRSGHLLLQAGDRVPPDVQPRHRHRHVVLSPLRPQRGRRAELHPAADVCGDQEAPADQRDLRQAADRRGRGRPGMDRQADQGISSTTSRSEFEAAVSYLPNKADWFEGRWAGLGRPDEPVLGRRNIADRDRRRRGAASSARC